MDEELEFMNENFLSRIIKIDELKEILLNSLSKSNFKTRENMIKLNYNAQIKQKASWFEKSTIQNNFKQGKKLPQEKINKLVIISKLKKKIIANPSLKDSIIKKFLRKFKDIDEGDVRVLTENFKILTMSELQEEIFNLFEIFGEFEY